MNRSDARKAKIAKEEAVIRDRLAPLDSLRQLTFGACCLERHAPSFRIFAAQDQCPAPHAIDDILTALWAACQGREIPDDRVAELRSALRVLIKERSKSDYLGMAQNAGTVADYVLKFYQNRDSERLVSAAMLCVENVKEWLGMFEAAASPSKAGIAADTQLGQVVGVTRPKPIGLPAVLKAKDERAAWVDAHPLVVNEREKQAFDLQVLSKVPQFTRTVLRRLRSSSTAQGIPPAGAG